MAIGYKLFRIKDGKLYPLYVLANKETPMGVWLPAECGSLTTHGKVKSRLGQLAYRPGWHINDGLPYVKHIYSLHNGKKYLKDDCVWCKVEYKTEKCYTLEAREQGWKAGKWSASRAYLRKIPVGGYYKYRTNPNMEGAWIIAGEMRVLEILDDAEVEKLCRNNGYEPLLRYRA